MKQELSTETWENSMNAYKDRTELLGGLVVLYRLDTAKSGNFQYRFKNPYKGEGYIRRSTKTRDLGLACKIAIEAYETAYHRAESGADRPKITIADLYRTFIDELEASPRSHLDRAYKLYWREYFSNRDLYRVNDSLIHDYFQWRAKYWKRSNSKGSSRSNKPNNPNTALATLDKEKRYLKWIFKRAAQRQLIAVMPSFPRSLRHLPHVTALPLNMGRGRFDEADYALVRQALGRIRINLNRDETKSDLPFAYKHRLHRYNRTCLWFYLLTIANSGIRPQEMRKLRFKDFSELHDEDGMVYTLIDIRKEVSKVKDYRDVVTRDFDETAKRLAILKREHLRYWGRLPSAQDLIFPHPTNYDAMRNMATLVKFFHRRVLRPDGTSVHTQNHDGTEVYRTAYSYRSWFVVQRLASGLDVYTLSRLIGTSVDMIAQYYDVSLNIHYRKLITQHIRSLKERENVQ
tara:strand:+ start:55 stop:1434 length:1380 start_codon:yes stop_codon:yes gene_type:complete